jgi:hypothetical protein
MKLKIELYRYGTLVFGKVLEMDEGLRNRYGDPVVTLAESGSFAIRSSAIPSIREGTLYVWGHGRAYDGRIFYYVCGTEAEASEFCSAISRLVAQVNGEATAEGVVKVM